VTENEEKDVIGEDRWFWNEFWEGRYRRKV